MSNGYLPERYRVAQAAPQTESAPQSTGEPEPVPATSAPTTVEGEYYEQGGDVVVGDSYFDDCNGCDSCTPSCQDQCIGTCRTGGCSPELIGDCWLLSLGGILHKAEYYAGAAAFQSAAFEVPQQEDMFSDCSFGYYTGANLGLPLCKITCGLVSGQVGVRSVQSDFSGDLFSSDNRDQLFVTSGLYRRVDYGLQFGTVLDYMRENWFSQIELMQLRGDIAWVYPSGSAIGFRFAENIQDDQSISVIAGAQVVDLVTSTYDQYRFYYRNGCFNGGWSDFYLGWSDEQHVIAGMEYDIPISECWAVQSGFTYLFPNDTPETTPFAGNSNDAWNISVGVVWRPQGRCWYHSYDMPILPVADNGSMVLRRRF